MQEGTNPRVAGGTLEVWPSNRTVGLRQHLANLLRMKGAHLTFQAAVADFPVHLRGATPPELRIRPAARRAHATRARRHSGLQPQPKIPAEEISDDYWPATSTPPTGAAWDASVRRFQSDMQEMQKLAAHTKNDLMANIPHGTGHTLLREALLAADHNSYHLGQLVFLCKMLVQTA